MLYSEMTEPELLAEITAWGNLIAAATRGPGSASNGARDAAYRLMYEADAWFERRKMEPLAFIFEDAISLYQLELQFFGTVAGARAWRAWQAPNCERPIDLGNGRGPDLHEGFGATPREAVAAFVKAIGGRQPVAEED